MQMKQTSKKQLYFIISIHYIHILTHCMEYLGHAVSQLVDALR